MERRRVQRVGKNTLTVSLPFWWVRKYGLDRGDLIYMEEAFDGGLILRAGKVELDQLFTGCSINADLCDRPGLLRRLIVASYVLGIDLIEVFSKERLRYTVSREARETADLLMGVSIMREDERHVILQCFLNIFNFPIYSVIRRMYDLADSMQRDGVKALFEGDRDLARRVIVRDREVNRLYYLLLRALSIAQRSKSTSEKLGITDPPVEVPCLRAIGYCIERMADWSKIVSKSILKILACDTKLDQKFLQSLAEFDQICREVHRKAIDALLSKDLMLANEAVHIYQEDVESRLGTIQEEIRYDYSRCDQSQLCPHFTFILWGISRQAELGAEIAEISIDMNMRLRPDIIPMGIVHENEIRRLVERHDEDIVTPRPDSPTH